MKAGRDRPSVRQTQEQFARQASLYAESGLHRRGESLETVLRLASPRPGDRALDVGTGTGFTAFALAEGTGMVVAVDPTVEMLREARRLALALPSAGRVELTVAAAERLAFADASFDVVTCRFAAHHFHDLPRALRELARVVKPSERLVICDVVAPESPPLVKLMNELEELRDPTHVWDYPPSQWREELLPAAGLRIEQVVPGKNPQAFSDWVRRSGTSPAVVAQLAAMFTAASGEARQAFSIRQDGEEIHFTWDNAVILARRPA